MKILLKKLCLTLVVGAGCFGGALFQAIGAVTLNNPGVDTYKCLAYDARSSEKKYEFGTVVGTSQKDGEKQCSSVMDNLRKRPVDDPRLTDTLRNAKKAYGLGVFGKIKAEKK
jgi:hypothetical protein